MFRDVSIRFRLEIIALGANLRNTAQNVDRECPFVKCMKMNAISFSIVTNMMNEEKGTYQSTWTDQDTPMPGTW